MNKQNLKVLVTGVNGFIGQAISDKLLACGYSVRGTVRTYFRHPSIEIVQIKDINANTDWCTVLHNIDVVIHLAARVHVMHDDAINPLDEFRKVNTAGTEHLAQIAAKMGVKRFVYVSSIKVNGESTSNGQPFTEKAIPSPQDPYGISKWEAEQALHSVAEKTGLEIVIVRPTLVYGEGVKGNFAQMLRIVSYGFPLPFASVRNQRDLIYVGNLADALIICTDHPAAAGQTYLLSDGHPVSTPELLQNLANAINVPSRIFPFPTVLLKLAGKLFGMSAQIERLLGSLQVDSGKIRRELNWKPPYTFQDGLHETVTHFHKE